MRPPRVSVARSTETLPPKPNIPLRFTGSGHIRDFRRQDRAPAAFQTAFAWLSPRRRPAGHRIRRSPQTSLAAERDGVTEHYGVCYEDGAIRIRLRHARTERLLKESSLVDTLCHELAHLRYLNHGLRFRKLAMFKRHQERHRRPAPAGLFVCFIRPSESTLLDIQSY